MPGRLGDGESPVGAGAVGVELAAAEARAAILSFGGVGVRVFVRAARGIGGGGLVTGVEEEDARLVEAEAGVDPASLTSSFCPA